jgi:hypothetical protein
MCAAAAWVLAQTTLPPRTTRLIGDDLAACLEQLLPCIEELAAGRDDMPTVMVTIGEVRRHLDLPVQAGGPGETERVRRIAVSLLALHAHHDTLTEEGNR